MLYMVTWIPSIYPIYVSIYTIHGSYELWLNLRATPVRNKPNFTTKKVIHRKFLSIYESQICFSLELANQRIKNHSNIVSH